MSLSISTSLRTAACISALLLAPALVGTGRRWAAVRLDDSVASFTPVERARNRFEWRRDTPDAWTAVIAWSTPQGPRERVYRLTRVTPRP